MIPSKSSFSVSLGILDTMTLKVVGPLKCQEEKSLPMRFFCETPKTLEQDKSILLSWIAYDSEH